MAEDENAYRALVGLNYQDADGNEHRVEAGDKITDMPENAVRHERAATNIEDWVPRQTENVFDPEEDDDSEVFGIRSRHYQGEIDLREVGE